MSHSHAAHFFFPAYRFARPRVTRKRKTSALILAATVALPQTILAGNNFNVRGNAFIGSQGGGLVDQRGDSHAWRKRGVFICWIQQGHWHLQSRDCLAGMAENEDT